MDKITPNSSVSMGWDLADSNKLSYKKEPDIFCQALNIV